ncbi:uncharacterized protein EDB91DRAFT_1253487 [Suillus paluster]|uniref:uncharacterized protein n=1 Tax=Suillus paluster TaxID=48578 RepID=UPI001B865404|nr:uncharacterized protein EDB91DRAFT_1253487 [Suillus paluster]KAG1728370.1 hypothetical protein EDB91DRAFT_1253487 [Suillus paluster]
MSRLINATLEQKDLPGDYFGIAFSVSHCAIVKVVKDVHETAFSHTTALRFLPSFFMRAMEVCRWHPGMDKWHTDHKLKSFAGGANDASPSISCAVLHPELWREIGFRLELQDILTLGLVSKLYREATSTVLRYPHVPGHRLVAVSKTKPRRTFCCTSWHSC